MWNLLSPLFSGYSYALELWIIFIKMDNKRVGLHKFSSTYFVQVNNYNHIECAKPEAVSNKFSADEITTSENNM